MKYFKLVLIFLLFPIFNSTAQHFIPGHFFYPAFEKGKYGYINSTGQWTISPKFEWCDYFYEGKAIAKEKGKYGFIDVKGEWFIKPTYDTIKHYSEGLAAVASRNEEGSLNWDFIDSLGTHLNLKVPALSNVTSFYDGRAIGTEDGFLNFFFFSKKGSVAFEANGFYMDENRITDYSEGLLHVYTGEGRSTFIDTSGTIWGNGEFENCGDFHSGMAWFQSNTKYGFINKKGEVVIPAEYDSVGNFSDGIALVKVNMKYDANEMKMKDGVIEYLDKEGKKITTAIYSEGTSFSDGYAFVKFNGLYGFINMDGNVDIDYQFEKGQNFFRGLAYVKKDNHWEYINTKGNKVF